MTQCLIIAGQKAGDRQLEDMLTRYGFEMTSAANANEALEFCDADMPDIILMPQNPTDMDAVAFIRRLRRVNAANEAKVIVLSEQVDSEVVSRTIWEGASDYLIGPVDAEILDSKLKQAGVV